MEVYNCRRLKAWIFEHTQSGVEDFMLKLRGVGLIERIAVAKRNAERPRRPNFPRYLPKELNDDRRDPLSLQLCRDQAHGLITHRSDRDKQGDIDPVLDEPARGLRRRYLLQPTRRGQRPHEGEMSPVHRADAPGFDQVVNTIDGESQVRILS